MWVIRPPHGLIRLNGAGMWVIRPPRGLIRLNGAGMWVIRPPRGLIHLNVPPQSERNSFIAARHFVGA